MSDEQEGQKEQQVADEAPMYVIEPPVPLGESIVWKLQSTFYADQGIAAWSRSRVPQSVTTSPIIASAYASIVLAFWRDMQASFDPSQPLYVVELGAGSGRFAFRFLKAFNALLEDYHGPRPRIVHVMTDAAPSVLEFWRNNAYLWPFVEAGVLDYAHFDLMHPAPMTLLNSGAVLGPGTVANPLVLFANYIFDSIPQDAYTIASGKLFNGLISLRGSSPELNLTAPDSSLRVAINYSSDDAPIDLQAESDPIVRQILQTYAESLADTTVLVPRHAMDCIRYFQELGPGPWRGLALVADLGDANAEDLRGHGPPGFGVGGGFWLTVNFHALGEYLRGLGGSARHPRQRNINLNVSMLRLGASEVPLINTELAYTAAIDQRGPDDLTVMLRALTSAGAIASLKVEMALALLRTSGWDSDYVRGCVPVLIDLVPNAEERFREELLKGVDRTWEQYYPIGDTDDLPFALGVLLYSLEQYSRALELFKRSLEDFGEDPRTTLNIALTMYRLGRLPETIEWLDRTLALEPTNELANAMRPDVAADLAKLSV